MNSIRHRLLIFLLIAGFIPLAIVMITTHTVITREVMNSEKTKVADIALHLASHVAEVMDRAARDLETLKTQPLLSDPDVSEKVQLQEMRRLVGVYDVFSDISSYHTDGHLICSTTESVPIFKEYSAWFEKALTGQTIISPPEIKPGEKGLYLMVYLPVIDSDRTVRKIIKARLSFARITGFIEKVQVGKSGYVILLDEWGRNISGFESDALLDKFDENVPLERWINQPSGEYTTNDGRSYLYASQTLPENSTGVGSKWVLMAMKPIEEVNAVLLQAKLTLAGAVGVMIIMAILLAIFLARNISQPLEKAGRIAREAAKGNLKIRMDEDGLNEIKDLAASFNLMASEVQENRNYLEKKVESRTRSLTLSQAELEKTSSQLKAAINNSNNGFVVEDANGRIVLVNQLFLDLFEQEEDAVCGRKSSEIWAEILKSADTDSKVSEILNECDQDDQVIDRDIILGGDDRVYLRIHSAPIYNRKQERNGRVWTLANSTEQKQLEESLRQSQKMEAIGQLAGGVAHDFNNLLTGIMGNLALLKANESGLGQKQLDYLIRASQASERAAELVKSLLGFSRRSHMNLEPCDPNSVINETQDILVATLDPSIRIESRLSGSLWGVMADPNLLSQVIMNMAVNARDAMENSGGSITFVTTNCTLSESEASRHPDGGPGDWIRLTVEDTGAGMAPEIQERIFEPFFTTKGLNKGTGLGLATSFGIIKQLGGWIDLESKPEIGTRFDIYLPRSIVAENQPEAETNSAAPPDSRKAEETILLVDDDPIVRSVGEAILDSLGYQVHSVEDGLKAIEFYREHEDEIDLVMLDLTMPGISGKETFVRLRQHFDYVPVLICSGYLVDLKEFESETGGCPEGFVQKPYKMDAMSAGLRKVLDASSEAAA